MRMMDELKHLFLYSSKKKVYVPIDEMDKRKNSAVLLLSPNTETSIQLTKMPYLYNPNLFKSYYIDRNVDAYIKSVDPEVLDFDEQEEEILSESLFSNDNVKFKIEDGTSYVDRKYIDSIYNKNTVKEYKNIFGLRHLPESINVKVYPNKGALKKEAPDKVARFYKDGLYSYSIKGTIHLISKMTYDERRLGPYDKYLLSELITYFICNENNKIPIHIGKAMGYVFSGLYDWINDGDNDPDIYIPKSIEGSEKIFVELRDTEEYSVIKKFIKTANIRVLGDYYRNSFLKSNKDDMFMEGELSYFERQRLLPSEFGIPNKRKYPMPDKDHVKSAIQMFNKCDPEDEKELADNIIKKIKKFDMTDDVHVGSSNRFKKYFDKFQESLKEETSLLCIVDDGYVNEIGFLGKATIWLKIHPRMELWEILKAHEYTGIYNYAKKSKDIDELLYLRQDAYAGIRTYERIKKLIETSDEWYKDYDLIENDMLKKLKKHNITVKDVDSTIKWFREEYLKLLNNKIKELRHKQRMNESYYLDSASNDYLHENIETRVTKPFLPKEITLYHGSTEKYDKIKPMSINAGTNLSKPRMSSFWTMDKGGATLFSIGSVISKYNIEKIGQLYFFDIKERKIFVSEDNKDYILSILKNNESYLYEKTIETSKVGRGHNRHLCEFTIDIPVTPDKVYKLNYNNTYKKYLKWVPQSKLDYLFNNRKSLQDEFDLSTPIEKMVYHSLKKNNKMRKEIKSESASVPDSEYYDILKICDNLSDEEFKRISFYDTYKDSKFIIYRIVRKINDEPVAFLDLYQFPSRPDIAQITLAVDENHRGLGLADGMVKELLNAGLPEKHGFKTFYWTAHENNKASMGLALKNGFIDTKELDKYGRRVFIRPVSVEDNTWNDVPEDLKPNSEDEYTVTENALVSNNMAFFSEVDGSMYSTNLKRYLYKERLKNNKEVLRLYDDVKAQQPDITKTYVKLEMYRKANVFIDLSYYNSLFLKNLNYKLDRGVNFYFEFMNRLINNPTVTSEYKMRTVFIPIDSGVWGTTDPVTLWDYRKNINPISVIFRLLKSNPSLLKKEFGKNNIIFVGSRGYFKIDFKQLDLRDLNRLKKNITKLMSFTEPIEDEYESDDVANDDTEVSYGKKKNNADSSKAMAMNMIDKIEKGTSIKLNNVSSISQKDNAESTTDNAKPLSHIHLRVTKEPLQFGLGSNKAYDGSTAIISLDPDGSDNFKKLFDRNGVFKNIKNVNIYCIPK